MFTAARQMKTSDRPELGFDAIILDPPPGWAGWGQLRVTALNHAPVPADLRQICRKLRLGGRIVSMLEVAVYDAEQQREVWPPQPRGGKHRCSDISEYRVPPSAAAQPGAVTFNVLIRPGHGLGKLGYKVRYVWADEPGTVHTGYVQP